MKIPISGTTGKKVRFRRLLNPKSGKIHIVPMDHGAMLGPIRGIERIENTISEVFRGGATALMLRKGIIKNCAEDVLGKVGIILRVSQNAEISPSMPDETIVSSCEEAIRLGADAVCFCVEVGSKGDLEATKVFGKLSDSCDDWDMPLLGEFYPAGEKDIHDVKWIKMVTRIGAESGADFIKTYYAEPFEEVIDTSPVPVVIAGGAKMESPKDVLEITKKAMEAGAIGVSIGRNVFQHENPLLMTRALSKIIHEGASVEDAQRILAEKQIS